MSGSASLQPAAFLACKGWIGNLPTHSLPPCLPAIPVAAVTAVTSILRNAGLLTDLVKSHVVLGLYLHFQTFLLQLEDMQP